jgi:hypothetical protein
MIFEPGFGDAPPRKSPLEELEEKAREAELRRIAEGLDRPNRPTLADMTSSVAPRPVPFPAVRIAARRILRRLEQPIPVNDNKS